MNTRTFLRLSLLIPFVVWGLCLSIFLIASALSVAAVPSDGPFGLVAVLGFVAMFYVFGIIVWIFPYLLLASILFFWSFISPARTALRAYALSPLAMTLLIVATLNIIMLWNPADAAASTFGVIDQGWVIMNAMAVGFALFWGYFCVGIGYGVFKLLKSRGLIVDEPVVEPAPQPL